MAKSLKHSYTPEKLRAMDRATLDQVRINAVRYEAGDLVQLCDEELSLRATPKGKRTKLGQPDHSGTDVVTGYHFVCGKDRGVTESENGAFWSGSWVVAEEKVRRSIEYGAYLALHETKSDDSYRQGQIVDYRRSSRDMVSSKVEDGIEFLVQSNNERLAWVGGGAGEKGYQWTKIASKARDDDLNDDTHRGAVVS